MLASGRRVFGNNSKSLLNVGISLALLSALTVSAPASADVSEAVFGLAISATTIPVGNDFTLTMYVTPENTGPLGRVSEAMAYEPGGFDLVSFDNSSSPFDKTNTEAVEPGTDCLTIDRSAGTGITSKAILTRITYKALIPGNYIINTLFLPGYEVAPTPSCLQYEGAWITAGNAVSYDNTANVSFSIVAPGGTTTAPNPSSPSSPAPSTPSTGIRPKADTLPAGHATVVTNQTAAPNTATQAKPASTGSVGNVDTAGSFVNTGLSSVGIAASAPGQASMQLASRHTNVVPWACAAVAIMLMSAGAILYRKRHTTTMRPKP